MPLSYKRLLQTSGIDYWDIRHYSVNTTNITVWNRHVKDFLHSAKTGVNVRIKYKGALAFAHADGTNMGLAVQTALRRAKAFSKQQPHNARIAAAKPVTATVSSPFKQAPSSVSPDEKRMLLMDLAKTATPDALKSLQLIYADIARDYRFENSEGSDIRQRLAHTYFGASVVMKGKSLESYDLRRGAMAGYEVTKEFPGLLHEAVDTTKLLLKARMIKGGAMPVVCDGALTDVFVHEAVGHSAEADLVLQQDSVLADRLGQRLAPEHVTLHDSGREKTGWGSYYYDDEGINAQDTTIIDKGVLKTFLHNRESAPLLGAKPTGNGRIQDIHHYPQVRMSNTFLEPGTHAEQELFQGIKKGVYLKGSRGGEVNTAQGSFLFNAQYGFEIKNGKLGRPVKLVSLGGKTLDILKNISRISKKTDRGFPGFCGKNGQSVQVEGVNPQITIQNALVGGK